MTNSNKVISTNAYDPKMSTSVWNFRTPSTRKTRKANQQIKNIAEYLLLRFFIFILQYYFYGYPVALRITIMLLIL